MVAEGTEHFFVIRKLGVGEAMTFASGGGDFFQYRKFIEGEVADRDTRFGAFDQAFVVATEGGVKLGFGFARDVDDVNPFGGFVFAEGAEVVAGGEGRIKRRVGRFAMLRDGGTIIIAFGEEEIRGKLHGNEAVGTSEELQLVEEGIEDIESVRAIVVEERAASEF